MVGQSWIVLLISLYLVLNIRLCFTCCSFDSQILVIWSQSGKNNSPYSEDGARDESTIR